MNESKKSSKTAVSKPSTPKSKKVMFNTKKALIPVFVVTLGLLAFMGYRVTQAAPFQEPTQLPPLGQPSNNTNTTGGGPSIPGNLATVLGIGADASSFTGNVIIGSGGLGKLILQNLCFGSPTSPDCRSDWASIADSLQAVTDKGRFTTHGVVLDQDGDETTAIGGMTMFGAVIDATLGLSPGPALKNTGTLVENLIFGNAHATSAAGTGLLLLEKGFVKKFRVDIDGNMEAVGTATIGGNITGGGNLNIKNGGLVNGFVTLLNGKMGIGNTNPATALDVNGIIQSSTGPNAGEYRIGGSTVMDSTSGAQLTVNNGGFTNVVIKGLVGVGGSPNVGDRLTVSGNLGVTGDTKLSGMTMLGGPGLLVTAPTQNLLYGNMDELSRGNLLLLQREGADRFAVDYDGNITMTGTAGSSNINNLITLKGGSVGIGNSNPSEKLDVIGNIKASGSVISTSLCLNGLPCISSWSSSLSASSLAIGNEDLDRVLAFGNSALGKSMSVGSVGIGVAASATDKLSVAGNIRSTTGIFYGDGSGLTNLPAGAGLPSCGTPGYVATWNGTIWTCAAGGSGSGLPAPLYVSGGNKVGINDSSPSFALDVTGDIHATGWIHSDSDIEATTNVKAYGDVTANGQFCLPNSTGTPKCISSWPTGGSTSSGVPPPLYVSGGHVGIGNPNPYYLLDIDGGSYDSMRWTNGSNVLGVLGKASSGFDVGGV